MKILRAEIRGQIDMLSGLNRLLEGQSELKPVRNTIKQIADDLSAILAEQYIRRDSELHELYEAHDQDGNVIQRRTLKSVFKHPPHE